jgi:hypothetical protein
MLHNSVTWVNSIKKSERDKISIFEKKLPFGWAIRKLAHASLDHPEGRGCYYDEHEIVHHGSDQVRAKHDWEWCDYQGNRLLWAENGKLFSSQFLKGAIGKGIELRDFSSMEFEEIKAPY